MTLIDEPRNARHYKRLELIDILLSRDGDRCYYCGIQFDPDSKGCKMTIDHVHPRCKGGDKTPENTVLACASCNRRKGHMSKEEFEVSKLLQQRRKYVMRQEIQRNAPQRFQHVFVVFDNYGRWECVCGATGTRRKSPLAVPCSGDVLCSEHTGVW
jgi:hypothetical protein